MADTNEMVTRNRKAVELKYVDDDEVGKVAQCLTNERGRKPKQSFSKKRKEDNNTEHDDGGMDEFNRILDEVLPEEYIEDPTNKLSEVLLGDEGSQFGFQTPKKRRGMTLKAQESASKYHKTPNKYGTPSKTGNDDTSEAGTPVTARGLKNGGRRTRRSSVSFGGEMPATPSKGDILSGTPTKSVLKNSRKSIVDSKLVLNLIQGVNGDITPSKTTRALKSSGVQMTHTPTRRQSMAPKMAPIEEGTKAIPKTPRVLRQQTKACLNKAELKVLLGDDSDSEMSDISSGSGDEFKPGDKSDSSEDEIGSDLDDDNESDEGNSSSPITSKKSALTVARKDDPSITPSTRLRRKQMDYEFATDVYFETYAAKDVTSNNTLSRLRNPRLREDALRDLLKDTDNDHKEPTAKLTQDNRLLFSRWLFTLREGFNILLYGLGSKRHLLQDLHNEMLCDSQVLIVNGFFPGLTIKEILDTILSGLLGIEDVPANPVEAVELLEKLQSSRNADTLYLLIHNLDGPSLKNNKAQTVLSKLAKISNVRVIASIDHINAPLLWDQTKLYRYNFTWWDVTTFLPYSSETSFESSLLIQRSGALQLSSLHSVFKSLTTNGKKIYLMIAKHQLENANNSAYAGLPFQELYWSSRNEFIVNSQMNLRTHLTEFFDHHMVKMKRKAGEESLIIPIENTIIEQFVQSQEEKQN